MLQSRRRGPEISCWSKRDRRFAGEAAPRGADERSALVKIERAEIARIRQALVEAGLLDKNAARDAA